MGYQRHPGHDAGGGGVDDGSDPDGEPCDVVHHADHGSQYTSYDFAVAAGNASVRLSFGSVGDAFDNAAIESFWARLKVEIAWIRGSIWFPSGPSAHAYLFEFIEVFYNQQRHQAGLDHLNRPGSCDCSGYWVTASRAGCV